MTNPMPLPNPDKNPERSDEDKRRKQATLAIAVITATSFIVVAWIMFLPFQLQKFSVLSDEEMARWQEIREEAKGNEGASLREAMDGLRDSYDSLEGRYQESNNIDYEAGRVSDETREKLRQAIEKYQSQGDTGTIAEEE